VGSLSATIAEPMIERDEHEDVWLIAGPTASGKSALALRLAEAIGGAVVNATPCRSTATCGC
jgi:tRNA dimethylallyltransferase